jgi:hypothetical protein
MAVWTVKLPNGSEKGPYEKEKLFELIEKGYFPVDSFFLASNSKKWIDMEAILDFQYQNVRESAAGFVSMDMNMQQSILPTEHPLVEGNTISLSTARKQKARSSTVHIGSKTHFNETLDKNYSKNIPMVQCDELGGLYESTAGYNRKSWKRIGYSRKPLQCVQQRRVIGCICKAIFAKKGLAGLCGTTISNPCLPVVCIRIFVG